MKSRKSNTRNKSNDNGQEFFYMLAALITLTAATILHENFHALIAWLNGWESETTFALITGQTTAITTAANAAQTPTLSFWIFFMFPSMLIFVITTAVIILKPEKIILIAGTIFQFLNLASIEPGITGSDAYNAVQFLITRGWTSTSAYGLHYIIAGEGALIFAGVLYISIENNSKDARSRIRKIFH